MRSAGGTKSAEPCLVTRSTKATMAFFGCRVVPRRQRLLGKARSRGRYRDHCHAAMQARLNQSAFMGETSMGQSGTRAVCRRRWLRSGLFEAPSRRLKEPPSWRSVAPYVVYLAIAFLAAAIFAFTASRLKLAPFCIGGNSIAVIASFSTCCWTNTKRQNSYLNQSKYCCAPYLGPAIGPARALERIEAKVDQVGHVRPWFFHPASRRAGR